MSAFTYYSRCLRKPTSLFSPKEDLTLSQRLLIYNGFISPSSVGVFTLWPTFHRVLDKLTRIIQTGLSQIGAQQLLLPTLGEQKKWEQSGRWKDRSELFVLKDRKEKYYCLQPTHEEEITYLLQNVELSKHDLPLLLYQISNKFRDEPRPRYGLFRAREFSMKDLYSFDASLERAQETYNRLCSFYEELFTDLQLPYIKVVADAGQIGGKSSHEYHIPLSVGEDTLHVCPKCKTGYNSQLKDGAGQLACSDAHCPREFHPIKGLEVAHCFLLGKRYSACFDATFQSSTGKSLLEMGCFGLGLTRLLASAVEHLSALSSLPKDEIREIRWPPGLAPFSGAIVLQKESAKDALGPEDLNSMLARLQPEKTPSLLPLQGDILIDDRRGMSLGRKMVDIKRLGIPWIMVAKSTKSSSHARFELVDVYNKTSYGATMDEIQCAFLYPKLLNVKFLPKWEAQQAPVRRMEE